MSYLKGKSALMMFDKHANRDKVSGAIGILNKHNEAKKVVNRVYAILTTQYSGAGYKYHETTATTQQKNLDNIVNYHNSKSRSLDISVHFNSASASATGTECLYYDARSLSAAMAKAMATALGITNRGAKERKELYFLRNTSKPAILLEVCFVTSRKDATAYHENFEKLCQAIAKVIAEELDYKKKTVVKTSGVKTHKVKAGDTLWSISQKYKTTVAKIKNSNGLKSDTIVVGQKLKIK